MKCSGINGLMSEGEALVGNISGTRMLDAAIISAAEAVEEE
jgi:ferritin-like metal-binding protein YciE